MSSYESSYTTIEDNVIYDNKGNVYISDSTHCLFQRNLVYATPGNICQSETHDGISTQDGIGMGDEKQLPAASSDNTIINNLVMGHRYNLYWWHNPAFTDGLVRVAILSNTFVNAIAATGNSNIRIGSGGSHNSSRFEDNIVLQEGTLAISNVSGVTGITFAHNNWSKTPQSTAQGTGDVIADPLLAQTGTIGPGLLSGNWFKILPASPARDTAVVTNEVTEDHFRTVRGEKPDIGAHEYVQELLPPSRLRVAP